MKFDLTPQETDIVMNSLAAQPWKIVNPVIDKMMKQANDRAFQGTEAPAPAEPAEPAEPVQGDTNG